MQRALCIIAVVGCGKPAASPPVGHHTPMPTGNGFGFAVYAPDELAVTAFYAHPYRFARESDHGPQDDGVATASLVERLAFRGAQQPPASSVEQSHVIAAGTERYYMPFGVTRAVLVASGHGCLDVLW